MGIRPTWNSRLAKPEIWKEERWNGIIHTFHKVVARIFLSSSLHYFRCERFPQIHSSPLGIQLIRHYKRRALHFCQKIKTNSMCQQMGIHDERRPKNGQTAFKCLFHFDCFLFFSGLASYEWWPRPFARFIFEKSTVHWSWFTCIETSSRENRMMIFLQSFAFMSRRHQLLNFNTIDPQRNQMKCDDGDCKFVRFVLYFALCTEHVRLSVSDCLHYSFIKMANDIWTWGKSSGMWKIDFHCHHLRGATQCSILFLNILTFPFIPIQYPSLAEFDECVNGKPSHIRIGTCVCVCVWKGWNLMCNKPPCCDVAWLAVGGVCVHRDLRTQRNGRRSICHLCPNVHCVLVTICMARNFAFSACACERK